MNLGDLLAKMANGEKLSQSEIVWMQSLGNSLAQNSTPGLTQPTVLSDIAKNMGILTAGEARFGNGKAPGAGFTGTRIRYPAMTYGSNPYHIAGVNNDVIQWGANSTTGKFIAGGGDVTLDSNGITLSGIGGGLENSPNTIKWVSALNDVLGYIAHPLLDLDIISQNINGGIVKTRIGAISHDGQPEVDLLAYDDHNNIRNSALVSLTSGTVFNETGEDNNFRVEGDTDVNLLFVDAGTDRVGVGTNAPTVKFDVSGVFRATSGATINDNGDDADTRIEGNNDANLIFADAGNDNVGIGTATPDTGYKLNVIGGILATNGNVRSATIVLNDDAATSFTPSAEFGGILMTGFADTTIWALQGYNLNTPVVNNMTVGSNVNVTTGALAGTTGTDGKFTVSADNGTPKKLYFENRRGSSRTVSVLLF